METIESHEACPTETNDGRPTMNQRGMQKSAEMVAAGSSIESIGGIAAVVLAILSLAGVLSMYLLPIATMALGIALLDVGGGIASRYNRLLRRTLSAPATTELRGGLGIEMLGGIAGIVLGFLALLQIYPAVLCASAVIVFGGTQLLSSGATTRLNQLEGHYRGWSEASQAVAREVSQAASGVQVLTGISAIVLGILALIDVHPFVLSVVAILVLGGAVLLSGATLGGRMLNMINRTS